MSSSTLDEVFLLLENPKKSNNLGPILRCAAAFGIRTVVFVGYEKCSTDGSHGAAKHINVMAFPTVDQAVSFLRETCKCKSIVGMLGGSPGAYQSKGCIVREDKESNVVSIQQAKVNESSGEENDQSAGLLYPQSFPIDVRPFRKGNCCFALSKDWRGLPIHLARCCDMFVHVPHSNIYQQQLLDTPSCISVVLHHFTSSAGYNERDYTGHKFEVQQGVKLALKDDREKTIARAQKRQENCQEVDDINPQGLYGVVFGYDNVDY
mmetsp:Transcript_26295/g.37048  ORF Transcript_26295/g.37048 Transcript_26295/m.37048 type:complete len:264 (+) Transcript_26295:98-889(+)